MKQKELTKMIISIETNILVSMIYTKLISRCNGKSRTGPRAARSFFTMLYTCISMSHLPLKVKPR